MARSKADEVRGLVLRDYVEPGRRREDKTVRVAVRDIHDALGLRNRFPSVCNALRSPKFLVANRLVLERDEGPKSGLSSTVVLTYRLVDEQKPTSATVAPPLSSLMGIAKEVFASLGGGDAFIRS